MKFFKEIDNNFGEIENPKEIIEEPKGKLSNLNVQQQLFMQMSIL